MIFVLLKRCNFHPLTPPPRPICLHGCFTPGEQVYSGEVDTVGGILAALNVTDWSWPPYASNIVLELWKRTETESLPRVGRSNHSPFFRSVSPQPGVISEVGMSYVFGRRPCVFVPSASSRGVSMGNLTGCAVACFGRPLRPCRDVTGVMCPGYTHSMVFLICRLLIVLLYSR